jgi:asparagine synthase (glutamine-hydrolysing)
MESFDGRMVIVFNGEVYNYRELYPELEAAGARFRTTSDTEVVVNAIRIWGLTEAVRRFIGMFAFAVWDRNSRELSLVRDRVGIKPLFYWIGTDQVLFGSEVRALLAHPALPRCIDRVGIGQYLTTGFTLGETTALSGVRQLLPGHIFTIGPGGSTRASCYWSLSDHGRTEGAQSLPLDELAEELHELVKSAFAYRLVSDVPVASFLSGGIDSSLVAAVVSKSLGRDIRNITIGFGEKAFDEAPKARAVAEALELQHEVCYVDPSIAENGPQQFVEVYDQPFGDTSGIPTALLCRVASERVKVALSADGGDEQFYGYESYARYGRAWEKLRRLPVGLRRITAASVGMLPLDAVAGLAARMQGGNLHPQLRARLQKALDILGVTSEAELVRTSFEKGWSWSESSALVDLSPESLFGSTVLADEVVLGDDEALVGRMMRADYRAFLTDDILTKMDRASMHVSLETRDPMLDHRIAEFAFRLPLNQLYGPGPSGPPEHKRIVKHLLRRWLPNSVVNAPKRGFSIPLYSWMRGIWKPLVMDYLSDETVRRVGILEPEMVRKELRAFYDHPGGRAERIWMLLNLHMWWDRWIKR